MMDEKQMRREIRNDITDLSISVNALLEIIGERESQEQLEMIRNNFANITRTARDGARIIDSIWAQQQIDAMGKAKNPAHGKTGHRCEGGLPGEINPL